MKQRITFLLTCLLTMVMGAWAGTAIPLSSGNYLDTSTSATTGNIENNDNGNLGTIYDGATATFTLTNASAQEMALSFLTATANGANNPQVTVTMNDGTEDFFTKTVDIENTGNWTPSTLHVFALGTVPAGTVMLKFAFANTSGYVCNLGSIGVYNKTAYVNTWDALPGDIDIAKGVYNGPQLENNNTNVGYIQNGGTAKYNFYNNTEGGYDLKLDIYRYNQGGTMNVKIVDLSTGEEDYNEDYTIASDAPSSYTTNTISISKIKSGFKTMTFTFSDGSSYICNYKNVKFEYKGATAEVTDYTIQGQTVTAGTETDYLCNLPVTYDVTTTFAISATNGTIAVTAKGSDDSDISVTNNGDGTYTIPTPALNDYTIVTTTLTPNSGAAAVKTTYTLKLFRIGEMSLTAVNIDGTAVDVLTDINNSPYSATVSDCYTTAPTVTATQIDGEAATVDAPSISGSTYTYTIHGSMAGGTITRDYTLILNNVHVYAAGANDENVNIKANEGTIADNTWSNGVYSLATTSLDNYNQFFKMNGNSYTLSVPSDVVVKQLIMKDCSNNYAGNDAHLTAVTSTGATAYIPTDNKYYHDSEGAKHDIIVNIEGHTAGTDIVLTQQKLGQPMAWIQLTIEKQDPGTAPVKTAENVNVVNNHAAVSVTFDREIPNDVTATINGGNVTAEGGATTLVFPVWNLSYSTNYTLTIPANAVEDAYGNKNSTAIEVAVNVPAKAAVETAAYDYVVSDATELLAALDAIESTNKDNKNAARKTVFLKNGDYDLGSSSETVRWVRSHNLSLIGESRDGVVIHGTSDGISNPVLNLRYWQGFYLQDLTVRNDKNYGLDDKNGVAVAIYGGDKTVMKNVRMQSNQDTQVTGDRAYFEDCKIHGTVDFICGGGDNFYYHTNLILENRGGNVIVAPSTNSSTKWGYVFQECTIKAVDDAAAATNAGSYYLGRPWQNEPRSYFLNTTMTVLPNNDGWAAMGTLPTHFYEYNSMNSNGDALDLSVRKNSPTSTNTYTPVLTDDEAAKYTLENVLGGTDSWLPTEECVVVAAPTISASGATISWDASDDARCYVIFKDGTYLANTTETSYDVTENGAYTVRPANLNGGLGATSNEVQICTITTNKAGWASFTPTFDCVLEDGAQAYIVTAINHSGNTFQSLKAEKKNVLKAGEGYFIKGAEKAVAQYTVNSTAETPDDVTGTLLVGCLENVVLSANSGSELVKYFLGTKEGKAGLYYVASSAITIPAGKCYLQSDSNTFINSIDMTFEEDATGIGNISVDEEISKAPVKIATPNGIKIGNYNIAGQRVK